MITEQLEIIRIFSEEFARELTINQIAKLLKKSYAFTNRYTHELIASKILNKKIVGSSILCSLNMRNEETIGTLVLNSIIKRKDFFDKSRQNVNVPSVSPFFGGCLFISKNKKYALVQNEISVEEKKKLDGAVLISFEEFRKNVRELDFKSLVICHGHELFWKMIGEML